MKLTTPKKLTVIRGLPGSGKSTLGRRLAAESGAIFVEPDMFLLHGGKYFYTANRYEDAVKKALFFIKHAECDVVYADVLPTLADVLRVHNAYFWCQTDATVHHEFRLIALRISVEEALARNVHHVNEDDIRRMADSWQNCLGEERCLVGEFLFYESIQGALK